MNIRSPLAANINRMALAVALSLPSTAELSADVVIPGVPPQIELVSTNIAGTSGSSGSFVQSISADGRIVAFSSDSNDLVSNDADRPTFDPLAFEQRDVFVRDLRADVTTLVSVNRFGTNSGSRASGGGVISSNGRFVAFGSESSDLVSIPTHRVGDLFVRDLQTGLTTLVSVNSSGTSGGNGGSQGPVLSADGRFVAFSSAASDLVADDSNGTADTFVRDLQTGVTTLISVNRSGVNSGNGSSVERLVMTSDGRFVAFASNASDLVANDTNGTTDVFLRDLTAGTTTLISVNRAGIDSGDAFSQAEAISDDGRFVAFRSQASNLVANDINGRTDDVFVRDVKSQVTMLASVNRAGTGSGNGFSDSSQISANGRFLVFRSNASDLVTSDTNGTTDVFVRDLQIKSTALLSVNREGTDSGHGFSREAVLSRNGRFAAFLSLADDLVANDANGLGDVFVRDLERGMTTLVSLNQAKTSSGNGGSGVLSGGLYGTAISNDGGVVAFESDASDLVTNDTNETADAFAAKIATTVPFARFRPTTRIDLRPVQGKDWFDTFASFTLGVESNGAKPLTEPVTIQIGTFSTTIPARAFKLVEGDFVYKGRINGVKLYARIHQINRRSYEFWTYANCASLTGTRNPVRVGLVIGDDAGSTTITARFGPPPTN